MWSKAGPGTDVVADVDALLASRPWRSSNPRARRIYTADRNDRPTGRQSGSMTSSVMGSLCPPPSTHSLPAGPPLPLRNRSRRPTMGRSNSHLRQSGSRDQRARAAIAPLVRSGKAECWRCGLPIAPDEQWDAGHLDDLGTGGHPAGRVVPEHVACNRRAGGRLGQMLRRPARRRPAEWLASAAFFSRPTPKDTPDSVHFSPRGRTVSTPTTPEIFRSVVVPS